MGRFRPRLTYANVMSSIAVFGVLAGGGAWAHGKIGSNQIKNNAVAAKHIKKNAVRASEIANNGVKRAKLAPVLRPRWAHVGAGTELVSGRGVVNIRPSGPVARVVEFDRYDSQQCSAVATPGGGTVARSATVSGAGENEVLVSLSDADGDGATGPFRLQVVC